MIGPGQDEQLVTIDLADGTQLQSRYLVGCEGGRSTVRKLLGVGFPGEPSRIHWLLGEVEVGGSAEELAAVAATVPTAQLAFGPSPQATGLYRFVLRAVAVPDGQADRLGDEHPLAGRRMGDLPLDQGHLYGLMHRGRGLLLDRTGGLSAAGWADRVDHVVAGSAVLEPPAVLLRPDGHVAWVGDDHKTLQDRLDRWFGRATA